jgi:hypothetical protein
MKFQVDDTIDQVQDKFIHTPSNLTDKIDRELNEMVENDIIERVELTAQGEISWLS